MTDSCIFCKIVSTALNAGISTALPLRGLRNASVSEEANATIVYRDEQVTAFRDIHLVAPTHMLIVPNRHIESVGALETQDEQLMGHLFTVARKLAEEEGISKGGYRLITNSGVNGGQTIFHLHVHLIGGQRMRYPMG
ncbi:MAG: histidine triad nucleotide-binding protein [Anaerolineales bacterium]